MRTSKFYGKGYAEVKWRAEDVKTIKPNWSMPKCEEWLSDYENKIQDRIIKHGWEVLEALVMIEDDDE